METGRPKLQSVRLLDQLRERNRYRHYLATRTRNNELLGLLEDRQRSYYEHERAVA